VNSQVSNCSSTAGLYIINKYEERKGIIETKDVRVPD